MRLALQAMSTSEQRGYLLACMSPGDRNLPRAQADADDIFSTMSDATLRELRDTAQRLANAADSRIVNPIQGIDVPTSEQANLAILRQDALDAIADAWNDGGARILTKRAKERLRTDWPELHNAVAALVGTLR